MTSTIIPFRLQRDGAVDAVRLDVIAAELQGGNRTTNLSAAQLRCILEELRGNRLRLRDVLDAQGISRLRGHAQLGNIATNLTAIAEQARAEINQLIELTEQLLKSQRDEPVGS